MKQLSAIIIARNAGKYLENILSDILKQDYPNSDLEIILVDGTSSDNTLDIMKEFKNNHPEIDTKILINRKKILSSGWNIALSNLSGKVILRLDANSRIPSDFFIKNMETLNNGYDIVGGETSTKIDEDFNTVIVAESSRFGGSPAGFRNPGKPRFVDTLAYAAYKREVFKIVGGYDERLVRTEDNDMHYRMKKAGFKLFYNPEIKSWHIPRSSLTRLLIQKYSNGFWIGITLGIQPACFNLRHFVPLIFIIAMISLFIIGILWSIWLPLISFMSLYFAVALFFTLKSNKIFLSLPSIFLLMHLAYGTGTLLGLIFMPYFLTQNIHYKVPLPIK